MTLCTPCQLLCQSVQLPASVSPFYCLVQFACLRVTCPRLGVLSLHLCSRSRHVQTTWPYLGEAWSSGSQGSPSAPDHEEEPRSFPQTCYKDPFIPRFPASAHRALPEEPVSSLLLDRRLSCVHPPSVVGRESGGASMLDCLVQFASLLSLVLCLGHSRPGSWSPASVGASPRWQAQERGGRISDFRVKRAVFTSWLHGRGGR